VKSRIRILATVTLLLAAGVCSAVERVEIVLDASAGMWEGAGDGPPHFVAVREALQDYAAGSVQRQGRPEIALRIVGGGIPLAGDDWCGDTRLVLPFGLIDPQSFREGLEDRVPRGGRPLVRGLKAAIDDLAEAQDRRRIVIITSGSDQCHEDIIKTIKDIVGSNPPIELRIIGLGLDRALANAATLLAPTRNLFESAVLPDALEWALQPTDTRPSVARQIDFQIALGPTPLISSAIDFSDASGSERAYSAVEDGRARVQLTPGRYRARIQKNDREEIELAGLVVGGADQIIEITLADVPPVTLEVEPDIPTAGGFVHIGYWGAPAGPTWVALAAPDSDLDEFVVRTRAGKGRGGVALEVPYSPSELEARFMFEPLPGVSQLLGALRFNTRYPQARIESPDKIENGKLITISWSGPGLSGDHITITVKGADDTDHSVCLPAARENGTSTTTAPADAGDYTIFYRSGLGKILARQSLEVFEVLATLNGPGTAAPAAILEVAWTGPDAAQDFLSIAIPGSPDDEYVSWAPTTGGNPARLQAPPNPGSYEVRYIRSIDGVALARRGLEVAAVQIELNTPESVRAGTRFKVQWTGSARSGDFLAVAKIGSSTGDSLDFSFAAAGSPSTLAAPFEPGEYEVRYVSGSDLEVVVAAPLTVH
jgi:Ca-activated chloride channel family protein